MHSLGRQNLFGRFVVSVARRMRTTVKPTSAAAMAIPTLRSDVLDPWMEPIGGPFLSDIGNELFRSIRSGSVGDFDGPALVSKFDTLTLT